MKKEEIIKQTTFVLSGHNIKWFAVLATETLIKECYVQRAQVVYFDDFSTDGTREELGSRGIRVISWNKAVFRNFKHSKLNTDLCVRVDQIIKCICQQIETRYVCLLDGDTAYSGDAVSYMLDKALEDGDMPDFFGIYRKARVRHANCSFIEHNIWQNYMWFDVKKLNRLGITDNSLSKIQGYYETAGEEPFNDMYDTGVVFYNNLIKSDLSYKLVKYTTDEGAESFWISNLLAISNHLGWLSSSMRNDIQYSGDWEVHEKKIRETIEGSLADICESVGLNASEVALDLIEHMHKSEACEN